MADEVSTGELGRSIGEVKAMVANLVGVREYAEYQRHVDRRFAEQAKDITDERAAREKAITEERAAREKAIGEIKAEQSSVLSAKRTAVLTGIGTLLGGIALAIFTAWAHLGGH